MHWIYKIYGLVGTNGTPCTLLAVTVLQQTLCLKSIRLLHLGCFFVASQICCENDKPRYLKLLKHCIDMVFLHKNEYTVLICGKEPSRLVPWKLAANPQFLFAKFGI